MFTKEKPFPKPVLSPGIRLPIELSQHGILLGGECYWDPIALPNPHIVAIGASGSGKTQTLKAIAYELGQIYPEMHIILIDFHGDQSLVGETVYPLHMASPYGINPLMINLDPEGGGPNLQGIQVATTLKKALHLGPNQEGLLLEVLKSCYTNQGIRQNDQSTWTEDLPDFSSLEMELEARSTHPEHPCKESARLLLKLAATFQYGIFSRPQPDFTPKLIRLDLHKLPAALASIAAESLALQLIHQHRLWGETPLPRTFLFIDEAKEMPRTVGSACDRIMADGRKYGLGLVLASQSERHLSKDVIGNSATKIVLPVDQTEVKAVARKFRFSEERIAQLIPLLALCRFGIQAQLTPILPYYQRYPHASPVLTDAALQPPVAATDLAHLVESGNPISSATMGSPRPGAT